ncbi:Endo-1,4-beta-xylanase Z precursor [Caloramator mitchellensis]|uniref:Endo-1,4-beta-xylanase Z n=1 Tax=Caloramator mitchellensis TaxID=908809 RepID=A0A0R3JSH1_CALMK|nr:alpha/beta hydrolase-fold protein [Caloramator mitchellensis]KRQ86408.1 Endo-1,4-beta-xylanase Z precursor [Caloramator mitchellensis]
MERKIVKDIIIPQLNRNRKIRVYLPYDYFISNKNYPVLYMHDGQNLFDKSEHSGYSWEVDKTLDNLQREGVTDGIIVVGIDCNREGFKRLDEYSPWKNFEIPKMLDKSELEYVGGEGEEYSKFIVETLKPMIDSEFRTLKDRQNTMIAGSSMGGVISLYIGIKYQDIFSKIGAFSTAAWFAEEELIDFIEENLTTVEMRIYLDIGTNETSNDKIKEFPDIYVNGTLRLNETISRKISIENVKLLIDEGATHSEKYWAKRFPEFIKFIYNK